jgi:alpha-tubulin suppressor-like RCC1 family protein
MKIRSSVIACFTIFLSIIFIPTFVIAEEQKDLFNTTYPVTMLDEFGNMTSNNILISLSMNEENDTIYLDYKTDGYNKQNWTKSEEKTLLLDRYTKIHHGFTRLFLIRPTDVKISEIKQSAYFVPSYKFVDLVPLEKNYFAQMILKTGEKLIDWAISKSAIPFANQIMDQFVEYSVNKSKNDYEKMFSKINDTYVPDQIPSFPAISIGEIETARHYEIKLDMSAVKSDEDIPISLWLKIALGEPSKSAYGSIPNRYGESTGIMINFTINNRDELVDNNEIIGTWVSKESTEIKFYTNNKLQLIDEENNKYFANWKISNDMIEIEEEGSKGNVQRNLYELNGNILKLYRSESRDDDYDIFNRFEATEDPLVGLWDISNNAVVLNSDGLSSTLGDEKETNWYADKSFITIGTNTYYFELNKDKNILALIAPKTNVKIIGEKRINRLRDKTYTLPEIKQFVGGGGDHFYLLLKNDGNLWALKGSTPYNTEYILGINRYYPVKLMENVKSVSAGVRHAMVIKNDGSLWAIGYNRYGQLGDGTNIDRPSFVKVMEDVKEVSAGSEFTMILKNNGDLWATGSNRLGQFGDGTYIDRFSPVKVMEDVRAVTTNMFSTMVIKNDSSLWVTGSDSFKQFNDGTKIDRSIPFKVMEDVKSVSGGTEHVVILKNDGSLWATGSNSFGQLGDGTKFDRSIPVKIVENVQAVSAILFSTIILKNDGSLWKTGSYKIREPSSGKEFSTSSPVKLMENIKSIYSSYYILMIRKKNGSLLVTNTSEWVRFGYDTKSDDSGLLNLTNEYNCPNDKTYFNR